LLTAKSGNLACVLANKKKTKVYQYTNAILLFQHLWPDAKQFQPTEICLICSVCLHLKKIDIKHVSVLYWCMHCNHQYEIHTSIGICMHFQCFKTNTRAEICQSPWSGNTNLNINIDSKILGYRHMETGREGGWEIIPELMSSLY
jgi:hypothetical protein